MRVDIRTDRIEMDEAERQLTERSVLLALGRFAPRVPHVVVSVSDATPEATRAGRHYQVVLHVGGLRRFLVIEQDRDLLAAIGRAADRARRSVERDLRRLTWAVTAGSAPRSRTSGTRRHAAIHVAASGPLALNHHHYDNDERKGTLQ